jgi:hypothetical protein
MSLVTRLANDCIGFLNARRHDTRREPETRAGFCRQMQRGYGYAAPERARQFLNRVGVATWGELDRAATQFVQAARLEEYARLGTRDFLGAACRLERLDTRIGLVRLARAEAPCPTHGFFGRQFPHYAIRLNLIREANRWRDEAMEATRHADFAAVPPGALRFYRRHIDGARDLYAAAMGENSARRQCEVPEHLRQPFFDHLRRDPDDLWGAYKAALLPALRHTARRLALLMTEPIPYVSSARSFLRSLVGLDEEP